jgi:hypothetical protein
MKKGYYFQFKASNELVVGDVTGSIEAYRWVGSFQPKDSPDYDPDEFIKLAARSLTNDLVRLHFPH